MNTNQTVWNILQGDLALRKDLNRKIINTRALAKYLIKRHELKASLDAVVSAIRRFEAGKEFKETEKRLLGVFKDSRISTRNNMVCITIMMTSRDFIKNLYELGENDLKLITGINEMKIIFEQSRLKEIKAMVPKQYIKKIIEDLGEISIIIREEAIHTKGVMARMSNEISIHNINMHELIVCAPEFLIYVKEKDLPATHASLLALSG